MSRYIVVMPSTGRMLDMEEQSGIAGAPLAESQAMSAKVGEAARASQCPAPRPRQALALPLSAVEHVVMLRLPVTCGPWHPFPDRAAV